MTNTQTSDSNILQLLSEGRVAFTYTTVKGETRNAIGTTNESLMPGGTQIVQTNPETVTYYDLNSNGIRTFSMSNLDQSSVQSQG